jgi:hypothetical protein
VPDLARTAAGAAVEPPGQDDACGEPGPDGQVGQIGVVEVEDAGGADRGGVDVVLDGDRKPGPSGKARGERQPVAADAEVHRVGEHALARVDDPRHADPDPGQGRQRRSDPVGQLVRGGRGDVDDLVRTGLAPHPHVGEHHVVGADGHAEHLRAADVEADVDRCRVDPPLAEAGTGRVEDGVGHFTAPAVRPPTRCFSIAANRMTTGTIAMREAAKSWSQLCW